MNAPGGQLRAGEIGPEVLFDPSTREAARRGGVSSVSWLLVFIPFVVVFLLIGRYLIAGVVLVVTLLWAVKDRKSKRLPLAPLAVFSVLGGLLIFFIILPILNLLFTTEPARVVTTALDPAVQSALVITLSAALIATLISLLFGIPLGYVLAREQFTGKSAVEGIVDMPVVIPHTIVGISLLFIFGRGGILGAPLKTHFNVC